MSLNGTSSLSNVVSLSKNTPKELLFRSECYSSKLPKLLFSLVAYPPYEELPHLSNNTGKHVGW